MNPRPPTDETQPPASDIAATAAPSSTSSQPDSWTAAQSSRRDRLVAGALVGAHYRIVAPLGRGGMGEVYRADDLELGQAVALKFLPETLADNPLAIDRLRGEVRIARQIAHPNVCRVYDIANVGHNYFLTMEFVDGEDLASVLRRMGHPSKEKAIEISRQICAGLHAAHELGVLHRDLKPANIMLDGRGRARITDFGLAGLTADLQRRSERAGTPAYMAPEQLSRGQVSVRSDVYSLGLILLELFTGKSPNAGKSIEQLLQTRGGDASDTISALSADLDPAVERVIGRCLAVEPGDRPASSMAVVAALPGGDPIAAALAAGETPSPQLIAASGESGLLPVRVAAALLLTALVGAFAFLMLAPAGQLQNHVPLSKPPDVLIDRAQEVARKLGYVARPRDTASGFVAETGYVQYLISNGPRPDRFAALSQPMPPGLRFWYRQSPVTLSPKTGIPGIEPISRTNPALNVGGMVSIELTPDGRLVRFEAVPPRWSAATQPASQPGTQPAPDSTPLLAEAGFDSTQFSPATPRLVPVLPFDHRVALTGKYPNSSLDARIEAGWFAGKLVYFTIVPPWELPEYRAAARSGLRDQLGAIFQIIVFAGSAILIAVNFANRRGDKRGAMRLAMFVLVFYLCGWVLTGARVGESLLPQFFQAFAFALLTGSLAWSLYMGLEPFIRRRSPYRLVSWSRLLDGRLRDPLVGRDILLGLAAAAAALAVTGLLDRTLGRFFAPTAPVHGSLESLASPRQVWNLVFTCLLGSIIGAMMFLILPLIFQIVLRSWVLAAVVFWLFIAAFVGAPLYEPTVLGVVGSALAWGTCLLALYRYGVVAGASCIFTINLLNAVPLSANWSVWYATPSLIAGGVIVALAFWGFYLALGGRSLLTTEGILKA